MGRKPMGDRAMTNAEKQVRQRQAHAAELSALRAEIRRLVDPVHRDTRQGTPAMGYISRKGVVCTAMEPERMAVIHRAFQAAGDAQDGGAASLDALDRFTQKQSCTCE